MKKLWALCAFLLLSISLIAEVDTLYTVNGYGYYCLTTYPFGVVRIANSPPHTGDTGIGSMEPISPNDFSRGYLTFDIGNVAQYTIVDSVILRLYTNDTAGNNLWHHLPVWDVANGDTVKLAVDLVDYGHELDVGDWTAGDIGDPQTIRSRCHFINFGGHTTTPLTTYTDVTEAYLLSAALGREVVQFRFRYEIDTDYDSQFDYVTFAVGSDPVWGAALLVYWRDSVSVHEEELPPPERAVLNIAPNPIRDHAHFSLQMPQGSTFHAIDIYDIRGRKVTSIQLDEQGNAEWDRRNSCGSIVSTGVYLCRAVSSSGIHVARKVLVVH